MRAYAKTNNKRYDTPDVMRASIAHGARRTRQVGRGRTRDKDELRAWRKSIKSAARQEARRDIERETK